MNKKSLSVRLAKFFLRKLSAGDVRSVFAEVVLEARGWRRGDKVGFKGCWAPTLDEAMLLKIESNTYYLEGDALRYVGDLDCAGDRAKTGFIGSFFGRVKDAFHTNEPQVTSVVMLSLLMLAACGQRSGDVPLFMWLVCGLFWPSLAFVFNLLSPIPRR